MAYVWINPVTDSMYDSETIDEFLHQHGHERIRTSGDWGGIVKEKYKKIVEQASYTVIDMRCPKIKEVLDDYGVASDVVTPKINPILIHCGQESSRREEWFFEDKIITSPCQALADMGNAMKLRKTHFIPWNQFVESTGSRLESENLKESPIPLGFFDELNVKTVSLSGEEEIRAYFENYKPNEAQLAELLFCKGGCHNGDGVRMCGQ